MKINFIFLNEINIQINSNNFKALYCIKNYITYFFINYLYQKIINLMDILICKFNKNKKNIRNEQMNITFFTYFLYIFL